MSKDTYKDSNNKITIETKIGVPPEFRKKLIDLLIAAGYKNIGGELKGNIERAIWAAKKKKGASLVPRPPKE